MSPNTFTCRHPQTLRISPRAWERDFPHPQASEDVQEAGWAFVEMSLPSQEPPNLNPAAHVSAAAHPQMELQERGDRRGQVPGSQALLATDRHTSLPTHNMAGGFMGQSSDIQGHTRLRDQTDGSNHSRHLPLTNAPLPPLERDRRTAGKSDVKT